MKDKFLGQTFVFVLASTFFGWVLCIVHKIRKYGKM